MANKLDTMSITPSKNGGFTVSHHYKPHPSISRGRTGGGIAMLAPRSEEHVFGPDQHAALVQHIGKHLNLKQNESRSSQED